MIDASPQGRWPATALLERAGFVAVVVAAGMIVAWALSHAGRGLDLTDEGFYLVWLTRPWRYPESITQFGFVYHPLYRLLGGDIAALRAVNIALTYALAVGAVYRHLAVLDRDEIGARWTRLAVAAGFATVSLHAFGTWLATPNYNTLTVQGLLVTVIGVLLTAGRPAGERRRADAGALLIGVGGAIVFLAKPSSAALLAVAVLLAQAAGRRLSARAVLLMAAAALLSLFLAALAIDGGLPAFADRMWRGFVVTQTSDAGYGLTTLLRLDTFRQRSEEQALLFSASAVLALVCGLVYARPPLGRALAAPLVAATLAIVALYASGLVHAEVVRGPYHGIQLAMILFAALAVGALAARRGGLGQRGASWSLAALLLALPHISAFGSNLNYWQNGTFAALFWVMAGLAPLAWPVRQRRGWGLALPLVAAAELLALQALNGGFEHPYRQDQPLRLDGHAVTIGPDAAELVLSAPLAQSILAAQTAAKAAGFTPGTAVIDLTGVSPGLLYALAADSLGRPWLLGGYRNSAAIARKALADEACDRAASAWLLLEPGGADALPPDMLTVFGAAWPADYAQVGAWTMPALPGVRRADARQDLYRPVDPDRVRQRCAAQREGRQP